VKIAAKPGSIALDPAARAGDLANYGGCCDLGFLGVIFHQFPVVAETRTHPVV